MVLLYDDTTYFPNLFLEELLCPPRLAEEARMVAFAHEPVAMPTFISIIRDTLPPARAFAAA